MWLARKRHRTNLRPSVPRAERKWLLPESSRSCSAASSKISRSRAKRADSPRTSGSREFDSSCATLHPALLHGLCLASGLSCNTTFSKEFLTELAYDRLRPALLAEICKKKRMRPLCGRCAAKCGNMTACEDEALLATAAFSFARPNRHPGS